MKRPLTETIDIQQLRSMQEEGMSHLAIANALGISDATVRKYLGHSKHKGGRRLTDEEKEQIRQMAAQGMTGADIADILKCSLATVYKHTKGAGNKGGMISKTIPLPKKEKAPKEDEHAACLIMQNKTYELHGIYGAYVIDVKKKEITIETTDDSGELLIDNCSFEGLENKINCNLDKIKRINDMNAELLAIQRKMKELTVGSEMW